MVPTVLWMHCRHSRANRRNHRGLWVRDGKNRTSQLRAKQGVTPPHPTNRCSSGRNWCEPGIPKNADLVGPYTLYWFVMIGGKKSNTFYKMSLRSPAFLVFPWPGLSCMSLDFFFNSILIKVWVLPQTPCLHCLCSFKIKLLFYNLPIRHEVGSNCFK